MTFACTITITSVGVGHCQTLQRHGKNLVDAFFSLFLFSPLISLGFSGTYPVPVEVCHCDHRALELLQGCVLCRFQDAFNLTKKYLGIIITVLWCQPEALARINVPLCEVL